MKYDSYSSDVGIQEFYKLFKYVSSKSAKVLLPGNLDIIDYLDPIQSSISTIPESARIFLRLSELRGKQL